MNERKPTYQELETKLAQAEQILETIQQGQADAVVSSKQVMILRLREAECALRESEEKLALAASGTKVGIFERNLVTEEIIATEQNARLLGLRTTTTTTTTTTLSQHYQYQDWRRCVHPEDLERVEAEMDRCQAEHTAFEMEYRVVWTDGGVHWIAARGLFQYDAEEQPERLIGILMDITERKTAEEALVKSEEKFRGLFDSMTEAFVLFELIRDESGTTVDCRIVDANPALEKMSGIAASDAIGRTMREMFPDIDQFWFDTYAKVEQTGEPTTFERRFDPLERSYHASIYRLGTGRVAAVFTDITARKEAEAELLRNYKELERFNRAAVGRELRMIELKKQVNELEEKLGQPPRYSLEFVEDG